MKQIILGAILGGLAMFVWEFLAHEVLPLGEAGIQALDDDQVQASLKAGVKEAGLYMFPMPDIAKIPKAQQAAAEQQAMEKMKTEATGIMVVFPQGRQFVMPTSLAIQFGSDVLAMLLAGILISWATVLKSYKGRLTFVALLGLAPAIAMGLPLWNWYGFPTTYTLAQTLTTLISFLCGGLALAAFVRPRIA